jgi:hypothetical protein
MGVEATINVAGGRGTVHSYKTTDALFYLLEHLNSTEKGLTCSHSSDRLSPLFLFSSLFPPPF